MIRAIQLFLTTLIRRFIECLTFVIGAVLVSVLYNRSSVTMTTIFAVAALFLGCLQVAPAFGCFGLGGNQRTREEVLLFKPIGGKNTL